MTIAARSINNSQMTTNGKAAHALALTGKDEMLSGVALQELLNGIVLSRCVHMVARLGLADLLEGGPRSVRELAALAQADENALYRVLRVLAASDVFSEIEPGRFDQTPVSRLLCANAPGSMRDFALMWGEDWYLRSWVDFEYTLRTGHNAFEKVHGLGLFDYLVQHPAAARTFAGAMKNFSSKLHGPIVEAYDFGAAVVADIGGNDGGLLGAMMARYPDATGILFDLPQAISQARAVMAPELRQRCRFVAGNFFESAPEGADIYVLKLVIHDWTDRECTSILQNLRRVMKPKARLLVVEQIVPEGNVPAFSKLLDVALMVVCPGRERTEAEFKMLFNRAGFALNRIIPTCTPFFILESQPV